jgi:hypothetical protein
MLTRKDFLLLGARASAGSVTLGLFAQPMSAKAANVLRSASRVAPLSDEVETPVAGVVSEDAAPGFHWKRAHRRHWHSRLP